jgi:uncharacterized membrane protein
VSDRFLVAQAKAIKTQDRIDNIQLQAGKTMTPVRVTIELPEPVFRQLARIAEAMQQSVEVLAAQSVLSNLPPSVDNASAEMQPELLKMQHLSIEELLAIANAQVEPSQHKRHVELLDKNKEGLLTSEER